jgi:hypothetical protein
MDKNTYNSLVKTTSDLQNRFDLICKVLQIEPSNTMTQIDNNKQPETTENINTMTSQDDPLSLMYETIINLTSPSSDETPQ